MSDSKEEILTLDVGSPDDFARGSLTEKEQNGVKFLLARTGDGTFHATGWRCSHYGAPLATGVLEGEHVRCPWHGACFHLKTGDIEEFPALDPLPVYNVKVEKDKVYVKVPKNSPTTRPLALCSIKSEEKKHVVIVGGGAAAYGAIQTFRANGFGGKITVISTDTALPVDRPKLSKGTDSSLKPESIYLRQPSWYKEHGVDILLKSTVTSIDTDEKYVTVNKEKKVHYDEVLIATGGTPRKLNVPGADYENVHVLRTLDDASQIAKPIMSGEVKNIVIIGASFIGLEIATWASKQKDVKSITIVGIEKIPVERVFGTAIGQFVQTMFEKKGTKFHLGTGIEKIEGENKKANTVILSSGVKLPADIVLVGAGVILNTEFLKSDTKITLAKDGGILVDQYLRASSGIYAAGDVAEFPYFLTQERARIEHWDVALNQGKIAALNILGQKTAYEEVPIFWTGLHGNIRYCGFVRDPEEILIDGKLEDEKWIAYYIKKGEVRAVATFARDPAMSAAAELFHARKFPTVASIKTAFPDLKKVLTELQSDVTHRKEQQKRKERL